MPLILPEFITHDEQQILIDWEKQVRPDLNINGTGSGCWYSPAKSLPIVPPLFYTIQKRIELLFWLIPYSVERNYGCYLSSTGVGGKILEHVDYIDPQTYHFRCNLFVSAPSVGGVPVVEGHHYPVTDRTLLAFFPSQEKHSCTMVESEPRRVVCSYGYEVNRPFFEKWNGYEDSMSPIFVPR